MQFKEILFCLENRRAGRGIGHRSTRPGGRLGARVFHHRQGHRAFWRMGERTGAPGRRHPGADVRRADAAVQPREHGAAVTEFFKPETLGVGRPRPDAHRELPHSGVTICATPSTCRTSSAPRATTSPGAPAGWSPRIAGCCSSRPATTRCVAAIDAPGLSALNLIVATSQNFKPSAQTEAEVAKQTQALQAAGPEGRAVLARHRRLPRGINAYLTAHRSDRRPPFTRNDIYASTRSRTSSSARAAADEAANSEFLGGLERRLGAKRSGYSVFNDLRETIRPRGSRQRPGHVQLQPPRRRARTGNVDPRPEQLSRHGRRCAVAVARGRHAATRSPTR